MADENNNNSTVEETAAEDNTIEAYKAIHAEDEQKIKELTEKNNKLEQANAKLAIRGSGSTVETTQRSAEDIIYNLFFKEEKD